MEIDVTKLFNEDDHMMYSASVAEYGDRAGELTWQNSLECEHDFIMNDGDVREAIILHFRDYGAWSEEELNSMSDNELNAMLVQDVSHSIREVPDMSPSDWDWEEYEEMSRQGIVSSRLSYDTAHNKVYFYIGD